MRLTEYQPIARLHGDVTSAYVDATRTHADGAHEVELNWRQVRGQLAEENADEGLLDQIQELVLAPTHRDGEVSRAVVGRPGLLTDLTLHSRMPSYGHHGPIAHLMPLVRARADAVRYGVVEVDHSGAAVMVATRGDSQEQEWDVNGDHDVLHKVRGGWMSHRRMQARVEDSWDRNAAEVANELDHIVAETRPDVVLLTGDPYARSALTENATGRVRPLLQELEHGGEAVEGALDDWVAQRRQQAFDRLGAGPAAFGVGEVVEALRRGEVETLVLVDGALDDRHAATGPEPLQLSTSTDDAGAFGVDHLDREPADEAILRALIDQDGALELVDEPIGDYPDGVAAVLRFDTRPG